MSSVQSLKIMPAGRLAARLARRRARGDRVVFTNGVFDLLHAGHVTLLGKARALGDCLVVGVNSDASVRRLKGPGRPLAPLQDRFKVLAALECVDYVTAFSQATPQRLIEKLKPSILVKGGDYTLERIVGRDLVSRVVRIPLLKGRSTSALVKKIVTAYGKKERFPPHDSPKVWRLLDANANRAREGLRVIEDTARFILNRPRAAGAVRGVRHRLDELVRRHYPALLRGRDVETDPGRENSSSKHREGIPAVLAANFKRCAEALRVLEEYGRVLSPKGVASVQALRYQVYQWEKKLLQSRS